MDADSNNNDQPNIEKSQENIIIVNETVSTEAEDKQAVILNGALTHYENQPILGNAKSNQATIIIFISIIVISSLVFSVAVFQNYTNTKRNTPTYPYVDEKGAIEYQPTIEQNPTKPTINPAKDPETTTPATSTTDNPANNKSCNVDYQLQPTECKSYTIESHGSINSDWKKYIINKYDISFEYPSKLKDYKSNRVEDYIMFEATVGDLDNKDPVSHLSSSVDIIVQTKSTYGGTYELVNLETGLGKVSAYYREMPYYNGTQYTYEFEKDGIFYNLELYNSSEKAKIMTPEEFKQLVESITKKS